MQAMDRPEQGLEPLQTDHPNQAQAASSTTSKPDGLAQASAGEDLFIRVLDYDGLQHYKPQPNRSPVWIKLYLSILDDYRFHRLTDTAKLDLLLLQLLASTCQNKIKFDRLWIKGRLSLKHKLNIEKLQDAGFIEVFSGNSRMILDESRRKRKEKKRRESAAASSGAAPLSETEPASASHAASSARATVGDDEKIKPCTDFHITCHRAGVTQIDRHTWRTKDGDELRSPAELSEYLANAFKST